MDETTAAVIEVLSDPEVNFGADPMHAEMLHDPEMLKEAASRLLDTSPPALAAREGLRERWDEADWVQVAQEFRRRLTVAERFFETDTGPIDPPG